MSKMHSFRLEKETMDNIKKIQEIIEKGTDIKISQAKAIKIAVKEWLRPYD